MQGEVNDMEMLEERANRSARSWTARCERKHSAEASLYPELRSWVQHAILEAERNHDFGKKDQLLSLLKEL
jgi:hypothetical protein